MTSAAAAIISTRESLQPLAALATREAGADGYALFRREADGGLTRLNGCGIRITEEMLSSGAGLTVACFPLHTGEQVTGLLAFGFEGRGITLTAQAQLSRMAAAIEQVWRLTDASDELVHLAARLGELEAALADSKIASRTRGFLQNPAEGRDLVDTVARHVESVLKPFESHDLLEQRTRLLEAELEERSITAQAKALLQATGGLSEEAAHLQLRLLSRKTRRPIREVALEVIAQSSIAV